jgi:hypothetical protein
MSVECQPPTGMAPAGVGSGSLTRLRGHHANPKSTAPPYVPPTARRARWWIDRPMQSTSSPDPTPQQHIGSWLPFPPCVRVLRDSGLVHCPCLIAMCTSPNRPVLMMNFDERMVISAHVHAQKSHPSQKKGTCPLSWCIPSIRIKNIPPNKCKSLTPTYPAGGKSKWQVQRCDLRASHIWTFSRKPKPVDIPNRMRRNYAHVCRCLSGFGER